MKPHNYRPGQILAHQRPNPRRPEPALLGAFPVICCIALAILISLLLYRHRTEPAQPRVTTHTEEGAAR